MPERVYNVLFLCTHLSNRISVLLALPTASLDQSTLTSRIREIGRLDGASSRRPEMA